ncbi:hypothetical protein PMZ80_009671 [Knufia obscura]|uniref:BTB domain-containing protein n=1 Tax=Knufia obscura TaxID=1635080 RepID=A0ABR0RBU6_9EURO|nr:hypothetical protein PMZ80_009671 [Knufia obscura]
MTSETIEIANDGDVILVVGTADDQLRLRVNSVFLRASSKFFNTLLGGNFAEGQNLSSDKPKEIPLPEDDPETIRWICQVAHLKNGGLPSRLDKEQMCMMVEAIDKYDLRETMAPVMNEWLNPYKAKGTDLSDMEVYLDAAMRFEYPTAFYRITEGFLRFEGEPYTRLARASSSDTIWRVINKLENERTRLRNLISQAINDATLKLPYLPPQATSCCNNTITVRFMYCVRNVDLTPSGIARGSLDKVFKKIDALSDPTVPQCPDEWSSCDPSRLRKLLVEKVADMRDVNGLCYYCTCYDEPEKRLCGCIVPEIKTASGGWELQSGDNWGNGTGSDAGSGDEWP